MSHRHTSAVPVSVASTACDDSPSTSPREIALQALHRFETHYLPIAMRRLAHWKGIERHRARDLLDDLRQELALDCLQHADEIAALGARARHTRWFRLVQCVQYRLSRHEPWRIGDTEGDDPGEFSEDPRFELTRIDVPETDREVLDRIAQVAIRLKNGRLNAVATARALGMRRRGFYRMWGRLVARLGFGRDYLGYWRQRLWIALLHLAACMLRRGEMLATCDTARARPSLGALEATRRRIERVRTALSSHPPERATRTAFARALGSKPASPAQLLAAAAALAPHEPAIELWRFEAAIAAGDWGEAARHLDRASALRAPRVPLALARARLAEAKGGPSHAAEVLRAALQCGDDRRLRLSLRRCEASATPSATTA